jgi:hypothetical protein
MRTTLEIDDDLLALAKQVARENGTTVGQVISTLARQSLVAQKPAKERNGVRLFPPAGKTPRPDLRIVNQLRDDS